MSWRNQVQRSSVKSQGGSECLSEELTFGEVKGEGLIILQFTELMIGNMTHSVALGEWLHCTPERGFRCCAATLALQLFIPYQRWLE